MERKSGSYIVDCFFQLDSEDRKMGFGIFNPTFRMLLVKYINPKSFTLNISFIYILIEFYDTEVGIK